MLSALLQTMLAVAVISFTWVIPATYARAYLPVIDVTAISDAVAFMPRATLVDDVRNKEGLALCGRGAACPG